MKLAQLLNSLEKLRPMGQGKWIACCPAHADRSPSLTIKQTPDTIMLYCWGGCSTEEVLAAVGMTFGDLYPENRETVKGQKWDGYMTAKAIADDALFVGVCAATMRNRQLDPIEIDLLMRSAERLQIASGMTK